MKSPWTKGAITAAVLLGAAGLALYLGQADLAAERTWLPRCAWHAATGLHCPGCGNTRSAQALLHGDVGGAVRQNAIFVLALPFLLLGAFRVWFHWMFPHRRRSLPIRWRLGHSLAILGLLVAFGVLRNVPRPPFDWLAPVPVTPAASSSDPGEPLRAARPHGGR